MHGSRFFTLLVVVSLHRVSWRKCGYSVGHPRLEFLHLPFKSPPNEVKETPHVEHTDSEISCIKVTHIFLKLNCTICVLQFIPPPTTQCMFYT
eukprot:NODE_309_length_971_cov_496.124408_g302_i0.p1 GENE.NODE_309_length_971_cov_496.124408_g302_i0~~NODE_309_length_971_cov_496.124408_g302_i0.p1  ORF type:complete len:93 (+),score=7.67 NODE_309_length_971_cov_496.124408_g302_i0:527-805(+)